MSTSTREGQPGCQSEVFEASSSRIPLMLDLFNRARNHLAKYGLWETHKKVWIFLSGKCRTWGTPHQPDRRPRQSAFEEVLSLQPGELVEVKSEREIAATLDSG